MKNWGRLITAMVTPMNGNLEVDYDKAVELAKYLIEKGSTALVVAGTTGESPTVTADEKRKLFTVLKSSVEVPIIAGVGTNSTSATIANAKDAEACGVDGLLAVVPYYNKPNQESLYAHFAAVAEAVSTPIMLYNVPGRTGMNMAAETTVKLSKLPHIVSLKEAAGNLVQMAEVIRDTDDDFLVYTGEDAQILPSLAIGAYGVVSVASHVVCPQIKEMMDAYIAGNPAKAAEMHLKLTSIFNTLFMTTNPIPVKAALNLLGLSVGKPRLPLVEASEKVVNCLRNDMVQVGVIEGDV